MPLEESQTIDAREYVGDEVLHDGSPVRIRAIRPDDKVRLLEHFAGLGARSRYFRFFGNKRALTDDDLIRFSELDFDRHVGLAATIRHNGSERFIAVGRYFRTELLSQAEIAVAVLDEYQGCGIGPLLIRHLAHLAHANGITRFEANVLGDNHRMLALLRHSGCIIHHTNNAGVVHFTLQCPESIGWPVESREFNYAARLSSGREGENHG